MKLQTKPQTKPTRPLTPWMVAILGFVALCGISGVAWACAGDDSCDVVWSLDAPVFGCAGRVTLAPGNDTRINMALLMRSLRASSDAGLTYPNPDTYGDVVDARNHSFTTWEGLRLAFWPDRVGKGQNVPSGQADQTPSCISAPADARDAFTNALNSDPALPATDRTRLSGLHARIGCGAIDWATERAPLPRAAGDYLAYLMAADAFYAGHWDDARAGFATLAHAHNAWLAETAAYMPIRIALRQSVANSFDQYGSFNGMDTVNKDAAATAGEAIAAYLKAWPHGRYVDSATGLIRRVAWLQGRDADLVRIYEKALRDTPGDSVAAATLAEEIDLKLLANSHAQDAITHAGPAPLLQTIVDLQAMRTVINDSGMPMRPLTFREADLAAQQSSFATMPRLYAFLKATQSWYAGAPPQTVLAQLPPPEAGPESKGAGLSPLAFSEAILRGMALNRQGHAGGADYWRGLIAKAGQLYQRPLAELGLALHWQQSGQIATVFAPGSPIEDEMTREILLQTRAGPAILRADANDATRPVPERNIARFILLYKDLNHSRYSDFTRDIHLLPTNDTPSGDNGVFVPGIFTHGRWSDGFTCPPLPQTVATLARNHDDRDALLCLGDFWRLNGFDTFEQFAPAKSPDSLGYGPDGFPGPLLRRDMIYHQIIANPGASADQRAYALYRAITCYAPSNSNCTGGPHVPLAQRRAWYQELKQTYPHNRWAQSLRYYW